MHDVARLLSPKYPEPCKFRSLWQPFNVNTSYVGIHLWAMHPLCPITSQAKTLDLYSALCSCGGNIGFVYIVMVYQY